MLVFSIESQLLVGEKSKLNGCFLGFRKWRKWQCWKIKYYNVSKRWGIKWDYQNYELYFLFFPFYSSGLSSSSWFFFPFYFSGLWTIFALFSHLLSRSFHICISSSLNFHSSMFVLYIYILYHDVKIPRKSVQYLKLLQVAVNSSVHDRIALLKCLKNL